MEDVRLLPIAIRLRAFRNSIDCAAHLGEACPSRGAPGLLYAEVSAEGRAVHVRVQLAVEVDYHERVRLAVEVDYDCFRHSSQVQLTGDVDYDCFRRQC